MPILESIALWAASTAVGSWLGHEGREKYSTDTPSKWSNASNMFKHFRGTLASTAPPPHSFPPPLRASAPKRPSERDFSSTLSYEEWARLLVKGDARLGLKNPQRAAAYARTLWIKVNDDGTETFSYPGALPPNEARKYVCAIHTGLLWAEEDLPAAFATAQLRRRVDSFGSSSSSSSSSSDSLELLVTPRGSVEDLLVGEEVGMRERARRRSRSEGR